MLQSKALFTARYALSPTTHHILGTHGQSIGGVDCPEQIKRALVAGLEVVGEAAQLAAGDQQRIAPDGQLAHTSHQGFAERLIGIRIEAQHAIVGRYEHDAFINEHIAAEARPVDGRDGCIGSCSRVVAA
ncbi:MAG: hypothetical protein IPM46_09725 [Flavobacteriales bacterium]|nr:hypothetical protein [Flavobacteriales bacterium]